LITTNNYALASGFFKLGCLKGSQVWAIMAATYRYKSG